MEDGIYKHSKKLIIVPDFANDEKEIFFVQKLKNHAIGMKEFSDIYHLGITDEKLEMKTENYLVHIWQMN